MSLDAAVHRAPQTAQNTVSGAVASDPAASILRHVVKIWARDHGVADDDLARVTDLVVSFASSAIRDCRREVQAVA